MFNILRFVKNRKAQIWFVNIMALIQMLNKKQNFQQNNEMQHFLIELFPYQKEVYLKYISLSLL